MQTIPQFHPFVAFKAWHLSHNEVVDSKKKLKSEICCVGKHAPTLLSGKIKAFLFLSILMLLIFTLNANVEMASNEYISSLRIHKSKLFKMEAYCAQLRHQSFSNYFCLQESV